MIPCCDETLLNWFEAAGAQCWKNKDGKWTVFVKPASGYAIQPTKPTLREAMFAAKEKYENNQRDKMESR
jgi:hypothetical protein